ncbi:MAG: hypothetical protein DCC49_04700 [Acidobacteria bacterium]|nr:MAG: hypothetical protein DCC49_04700 [Acidobacteriota bacterium]
MKRGGRPAAFRLAARELISRLDLDAARDFAFVTWVPAGRGARDRGFDQGRELAVAVASALRLEAVPTLRRAGKDRQHMLDREMRLEADVFSVRRGLRAAHCRALLVDDVTTTGASLYFASLALKEAGVPSVEAATFARTQLRLQHHQEV